jgi:hypothetical protein
MTIRSKEINTGTAAGGAGVATATGKSNGAIDGRILAVGIKYLDTPPATTDVTLKTSGQTGPVETILTVSNAAADGWFYPRTPSQDAVGADVTFDGNNELYEPFVVADQIEAAILQADDGDSAVVTVVYEN